MTGILESTTEGKVLLHSEELDTFYIGDTYEQYGNSTHKHQLMEYLEFVLDNDIATSKEEDIAYKVQYGEFVKASEWGYVKSRMDKSEW